MSDDLFLACPDWDEARLNHMRYRDTQARSRDRTTSPSGSPLSLDELMSLAAAVGDSYVSHAIAGYWIAQVVASMWTHVVEPVLGKRGWIGPITLEQNEAECNRSERLARGWGFACFGLGLEQGLGGVAAERGLRHMDLICRSYGVYAGQLLLARSMYSERVQALASAHDMLVSVHAWGIRAWDIGYEASLSAERKSDLFLTGLEKLGGLEPG